MGSPYQSGETKDEGIVTEDQGGAETEDWGAEAKKNKDRV